MQASLQQEFFARIGPQELGRLFEHLSGGYFFIKDDRSRMVAANRPLLERMGVRDGAEYVGATDHDFFPRPIATHFIQDDRRVLQTEQPLLNVIELWRNAESVITSKFPVRDTAGRTIGIMGMFRVLQGETRDEGKPDSLRSDGEIHELSHYLRSHLHERHSVEQLAERVLLSVRQLRRRFHQVFGMSVQQFLIEARVQAASMALLHTDASVAEIATRLGFYDQSNLTHQFRRHTGITPRKFRQQNARHDSRRQTKGRNR